MTEAQTTTREIKPENIPEELTRLAQWINWAGIWSEDKKKFSKPPMKASGRNGSSTDETTWTTLEKARAALGREGVYVDNSGKRHHVTLDGIGLAGLERTSFTAIDLDNCIDPETGEINPAAQEIVEKFDSYTEITPSGVGLRIWIKADKPPTWCANKTGETEIEVYAQGRFFTVTGRHLEGTPRTIESRQEALDAFMVEHAPADKPKPKREPYTGSVDYVLDLDRFLEEFGVVVLKQARDATSERAYYIVCPWAHEHTGGDTSGTRVGQYPSGALWFHCDHGHCDGREWEHFREKLDPKAYRGVKITVGGQRLSDKDEEEGESEVKPQGKPSDDELRDGWRERNPNTRFGLQDWRKYENGIWVRVPEEHVSRSVMRVLEDAKEYGIRPTSTLLRSVRELARIEAFVPDEKWDDTPDILICENGAVEIATGELKPHDPEHYATTRVPYAFDPDAPATNWYKFIAGIEEQIRDFLQEFAGYSLTTDVSLERAVWLVGRPGGGKSTFLEGLKAMLGDRAGPLGLADIERSQFALQRVVGKTLVLAAEQPGGYISSHHIIQALISGEPLTVERKHKDPFEYRPIAKVAWAMNETPRIPTAAEGLFRRVSLVNFAAIPESDRDPTIKEGIKSEGAAIFNWALEGLQRLRDRGDFRIPNQVKEDTEELRESNDPSLQFLSERCIQGEVDKEEYITKGTELYKDYKEWCAATSHKAKGTTRIGDDWLRLGLKRHKRVDGVYWGGVKLRYPGRFYGYSGDG